MAQSLCAQNLCVPPKVQRHTTITTSDVSKIRPHGIVAVANGFWVTGTTTHTSGNMDFLIAKFNDSGRLLFMKRLGTAGEENSYPVGIAATASGGCVIAGRSHEPDVGCGLAAVAYINPDGTLKWWRRTTSRGNWDRYDAFRNVMVRKDGTVFGCGSSHQWNYDSQLLLAALDSNGKEIFRNSYRYGGQTHMGASAELGSGYVVGGHDGNSPVLLTVTAAGVVDKCFGYRSPNMCTITSLTVSPSGKIYVTGGNMESGNYELWAACIHPSTGNVLWQKRYSPGYSLGGKIEWIDNSLIVSFMYNTGGTNWHNGIARLDSGGNVQNVKLIRLKNVSFENHLSGINSARLPGGGMAFTGTNSLSGANLGLALINPCDTALCSVYNTRFTAVYNTAISLTANKGTMYYDGNFATNLSASLTGINYIQTNNCSACDPPVPTRFRDTTLCLSNSAVFKVKDYSASVLWSDGDTAHQKAIAKAGIYHVTLSKSCGIYRDTLEVKYIPAMVKVLPKTFAICAGTVVSVDATQPLNQKYSYSWNDGLSNSKRFISSQGTYILTTYDTCGSRRDTVTVIAKTLQQIPKLKDTLFCDTPFAFTQRIAVSSANVLWNDGDTSHIKTFTKPGSYVVKVTDTCGFYIDTFEISRNFPPVKVLSDTQILCRGNTLLLNGTQQGAETFSYRWSNGDKSPVVTVKNRSTMTLVTSNLCGSRTDQVEVYLADCDCDICVPSAFTPRNRDGRNDMFKPGLNCKSDNCVAKESFMRIYNKWGEKLFDGPAFPGWDGTYKGEVVPEGQYVYIIQIIFDNQSFGTASKEASGWITVLSGN